MQEQWKTIDVRGYRTGVSSEGRVQNDSGKTLTPWIDKRGYYMVAIQKAGVRKKFSMHRLIGTAFCPGYAEGLSIDQVNGIKTDNRVENLEWVSLAENTSRQWRTGLVNLRGEKSATSRLTAKQVKYIRHLHRGGVAKHALAVVAGISHRAITKIVNGETWQDIDLNEDGLSESEPSGYRHNQEVRIPT